MRAIRGDESPLSYLQAAVCYHELHQYSYNKNPQWGPQRILDDRYIEQVTQMGLWPFITIIRSLDPIFFYDSLHHPVVIFYTYKSFGEESLQKHIHRFDFEGYGMKMNERSIAVNNKLPFLWNRLGFNE
ncbi:hypothetical protein [Halobacillus amylolyticus]|uniref:Uncharacterized protein n=1 Tax=Halobacillus amylolyticus TaxID=2932259 RepID=A0ABY4HAC7_9BACI|nr:hypothetical protein [Halobacillus amylolyticus]UOR11639.1 hypothetical protein MUO15_18995 [Halobacillus amylolyticus]